MNFPFHYYGTYCAAREAGISDIIAWEIACAAQFVDDCTKTMLKNHGFENRVATCHSKSELVEMSKGWFGAPFPDEVPQVWTSFHFLPGNLTRDGKKRLSYRNGKYLSKISEAFKLLCLPYGQATGMIVDRAKTEYNSFMNSDRKKLAYVGMVMHVLADTFAHEYFVGIPSEAINESSWIIEYKFTGEQKPYALSDIKSVAERSSPYYAYAPAFSETSLGWLGHGRVGTYPDIPDKRYRYTPNWDPDAECFKDNPLVHLSAFHQMTEALKFIFDKNAGNEFDYKKELTHEEYASPYYQKLLEIFKSDGDNHEQEKTWSKHISASYTDSTIKEYSADILASNKGFLSDFMDNADEHRKLVCRYCYKIAPSLKYFNI